jgi:hypothetical protein
LPVLTKKTNDVGMITVSAFGGKITARILQDAIDTCNFIDSQKKLLDTITVA